MRRVPGQETTESVGAITSLGPERAPAVKLLAMARGHWGIENRVHWVRARSLGEDACRVRTGSAPQVRSGRRKTVRDVLRATGRVRSAAALRHLAARPNEAVQKVIQPLPSEL